MSSNVIRDDIMEISELIKAQWWDEFANLLRGCYTPYRVDLEFVDGNIDSLQDWTAASAAESLSTLELNKDETIFIDARTKEMIIGYIAQKDIGIRVLFMTMQDLALTGIKKGEHVSKILREIVNPRNGKLRSAIVKQALETDYVTILIRILKDLLFIRNRGKVQAEQLCVDATIVNLLWFLSAVGTNDSGFASKVRQMLKVKFFHHDLFKKIFFAKSAAHYPLLKILRQLTRNEHASQTLGKDSVMTTLRKCFAYLPNMPGQKLQILLDIVAQLTKDRNNCRRFVKIGLISKIIRVFSNWERWRGKGLLKMSKNILVIYNRLARGKSGRKTLIQSDAISQIRKFCDSCPPEKSFTDVIMRCAGMLATIYEKDQLPVEAVESPLEFKVPEDGKMPRVHDSGSSSDDEGSESENDSGEDDDVIEHEDIEEDDDDSTDDYEKSISDDDFDPTVEIVPDSNNSKSSKRKLSNQSLPDNKTTQLQISASNNLDILKSSYQVYFQEFYNSKLLTTKAIFDITGIKQKDSIDSVDENCNLTRKVSKNIPRSEHKYAWLSALQDCRYIYWDSSDEMRRQYSTMANEVFHVAPFVKIAYPDFTLGHSFKSCENMLPPADRCVLRNRIIAYMTRLAGSDYFKAKTAYSLDELIKKKDPEQISLKNYDEKEAGKFDKKSGLQFEARFESGNLRKAIQIGDREYDLLITSDVNSKHHNQWFYFQVSNTLNDKTYTFNIINCTKANSSFNYGMQPVVYSVTEALRGRPGWVRSGTDICYYKNGYKFISKKRQSTRVYHTASFNIQFQHKGDICYIAYHMPYPYTRLMVELKTMIKAVEKDTDNSDIHVKCETLCLSLNKNAVPVVTISSAKTDNRSKDSRRIIFLTARVHPGETNASWVMKGILEYLLFGKANNDLFKKYVFKIVPMLNVEGVINGCHRCGLTAEDLNRCWKSPSEIFHPTIFHTKMLIEYCSKILNAPPLIYCDLHGHSRRKNVFLYGCSLAKSWNSQDKLETEDSKILLSLPESMDEVSSAFCLQTCKYDVTRGRETTARVAVWRDYKIARSYTLECSYCGCDRGPYKGTAFGTNQLLEIGKDLCQAFLELQTQ